MGAHPADTWCQKRSVGDAGEEGDPSESDTYTNWLSDEAMLPRVLPHARIMRYGYKSGWYGDKISNETPRTVS
jgi:hypothetical protein